MSEPIHHIVAEKLKKNIMQNYDTISASNEHEASKKSSLGSLIVWNISKAMELNPSMDIKIAMEDAQARIDDARDLGASIGDSELRHFACAMLAWQQMGHSDTDSLYRFINNRIKEDEMQNKNVLTLHAARSGPNEVPEEDSYTNAKIMAISKDIKSMSFGSDSIPPVIKLPIESQIVMRVDNKCGKKHCKKCTKSAPTPPPYRPPSDTASIKTKINALCSKKASCSNRLASVDQTTSNLRSRASMLAKREAERVTLLQRAEAAWKDLERGFERRLQLAEEKEVDMLRQIKKAIDSRNVLKNANNELAAELKERGNQYESDRLTLSATERKLCDLACERLRLNEQSTQLDGTLADYLCKIAQLDRDIQFREEQARRKLLNCQSELESSQTMTHETERAMRAELLALKDQVAHVSKQLLQEDAENAQIQKELDSLREEKMGMVEDLEGCKNKCDKRMEGKMGELKKKQEQYAALQKKVTECKCKLPVDEVVEVKRTASLAAQCSCDPEDKVLKSCSCTSLRSRLMSSLLSDLFKGLTSEMCGAGQQMPCQMLKCLDDKHNWDKSSVVKTNLENYFDKLLMGELDIAIATSIEKYHAKWVGTSCADIVGKMQPDDDDDEEGWQKRAIELRAQDLAQDLAEQLFEERAEELEKRAKDVIAAGPPPCECSEKSTKKDEVKKTEVKKEEVKKKKYPTCCCPDDTALYPVMTTINKNVNNKSKLSSPTRKTPVQCSEMPNCPSYMRLAMQDVTKLRRQLDHLNKETIKKEDLKMMEDNITKIVQQAGSAFLDISEDIHVANCDIDTINKEEDKRYMDYNINDPNYYINLQKPQKKSNIIFKKNQKYPKSSYSNASESNSKDHKKHGQNYSINMCLCSQKRTNKVIKKNILMANRDESQKEKSSKNHVAMAQSGIKQAKPICCKFKTPVKQNTIKESQYTLKIKDDVVKYNSPARSNKPSDPFLENEPKLKLDTNSNDNEQLSCLNNYACFHKDPSNKSLDQLLEYLARWTNDTDINLGNECCNYLPGGGLFKMNNMELTGMCCTRDDICIKNDMSLITDIHNDIIKKQSDPCPNTKKSSHSTKYSEMKNRLQNINTSPEKQSGVGENSGSKKSSLSTILGSTDIGSSYVEPIVKDVDNQHRSRKRSSVKQLDTKLSSVSLKSTHNTDNKISPSQQKSESPYPPKHNKVDSQQSRSSYNRTSGEPYHKLPQSPAHFKDDKHNSIQKRSSLSKTCEKPTHESVHSPDRQGANKEISHQTRSSNSKASTVSHEFFQTPNRSEEYVSHSQSLNTKRPIDNAADDYKKPLNKISSHENKDNTPSDSLESTDDTERQLRDKKSIEGGADHKPPNNSVCDCDMTIVQTKYKRSNGDNVTHKPRSDSANSSNAQPGNKNTNVNITAHKKRSGSVDFVNLTGRTQNKRSSGENITRKPRNDSADSSNLVHTINESHNKENKGLNTTNKPSIDSVDLKKEQEHNKAPKRDKYLDPSEEYSKNQMYGNSHRQQTNQNKISGTQLPNENETQEPSNCCNKKCEGSYGFINETSTDNLEQNRGGSEEQSYNHISDTPSATFLNELENQSYRPNSTEAVQTTEYFDSFFRYLLDFLDKNFPHVRQRPDNRNSSPHITDKSAQLSKMDKVGNNNGQSRNQKLDSDKNTSKEILNHDKSISLNRSSLDITSKSKDRNIIQNAGHTKDTYLLQNESKYMGAINLDKSYYDVCKCSESRFGKLDLCLPCICKSKKSKNKSMDVQSPSLGKGNLEQNKQIENLSGDKNQPTSLTKNMKQNIEIKNPSDAYDIQFLGVTLTDVNSQNYEDTKDQNNYLGTKRESENEHVKQINKPKEQILMTLETKEKPNDNQNQPHNLITLNNDRQNVDNKQSFKKDSKPFGFEGKIDPDFVHLPVPVFKETNEVNVSRMLKTKQTVDTNKTTDITFSRQRYENKTSDIPLPAGNPTQEPCVCCNTKCEDSHDLEENTFNLLEEHLKHKLKEFEQFTCNEKCIPSEEQKKLFNTILDRVRNVIIESTSKITCKCSQKDATSAGSWNRAYGLLQEYLKTKIKRVQCSCSLAEENNDTILPDVLDKVFNLIEYDFQRLQDVCRCKKEKFGGNIVNETLWSEVKPQEKKENIKSPGKLESLVLCNCFEKTKTRKTPPIEKRKHKRNKLPSVGSAPVCACDFFECSINGVPDKTNAKTFHKSPFHEVITNICEKSIPDLQSVHVKNVQAKKCNNESNTDERHKTVLFNNANVNTSSHFAVKHNIDNNIDSTCNTVLSCFCSKSKFQKKRDNVDSIVKDYIDEETSYKKQYKYLMNNINSKDATHHKNDDLNTVELISSVSEDMYLQKILKNNLLTDGTEDCETEINIQDEHDIEIDWKGKYGNAHIRTNTLADSASEVTDYSVPLDWCGYSLPDSLYSDHNNRCGSSDKINEGVDKVKKVSAKSCATSFAKNCDCDMVPLCHVKMLVENIESKLVSAKCTCDSMTPQVCPVHSTKD